MPKSLGSLAPATQEAKATGAILRTSECLEIPDDFNANAFIRDLNRGRIRFVHDLVWLNNVLPTTNMSTPTVRADSLIDRDLWDFAKWRQTAFLTDPADAGQPGIAIQFECLPGGEAIFDGWRKRFGGSADRDEILRIALIHGKHPIHGHGFTTSFSTDPTPRGFVPKPASAPAFLITETRYRFQSTPEKRPSFDRFCQSFQRHKMCFVVPMSSGTSGECVPDIARCIGKTRLYIRTFDEVAAGGDGDLDSIVLT